MFSIMYLGISVPSDNIVFVTVSSILTQQLLLKSNPLLDISILVVPAGYVGHVL
jgi:hypothetical protein